MFASWLSPVIAWTGFGIVPLLLIVIVVILIVKD